MLRVAAAKGWIRSEEEGRSSYYAFVFLSRCIYILIHECSVLQQRAGGLDQRRRGGVATTCVCLNLNVRTSCFMNAPCCSSGMLRVAAAECSVLQQRAGGMDYRVWGGVWGGYD